MKRSGFKSAWTPPPKAPAVPMREPAHATLRVPDQAFRMTVPVPKEHAVQHDGYMNLVRAMPCAHCSRPPRSQFCHSDQGKGTSIKTDCRRGWPGCGPTLGRQGCHALIGSTGTFTRDQRRTLEDKYAAQTRAAIEAAGLWPASLPMWAESKEIA